MDEDKRLELGLKYAWDWFSYHANQRVLAFRFFLLVALAIGTGYGTLFQNKLYAIAAILGLLGAVISFAFFQLERRNNELVNDGRDVLDELEAKISIILRRRDQIKSSQPNEIPTAKAAFERKRTTWFGKHWWWLRFIQWVSILSFLLAAWLAFSKA